MIVPWPQAEAGAAHMPTQARLCDAALVAHCPVSLSIPLLITVALDCERSKHGLGLQVLMKTHEMAFVAGVRCKLLGSGSSSCRDVE